MAKNINNLKEKVTGNATIPVPIPVNELKENDNTKDDPKLSREEIINQAFSFHSKGNILEAIKYYQYFIKQGFKDHKVFSNFGKILIDLGKLKEAEVSLRNAIELKPDAADNYTNMGNMFAMQGNAKEAELYYRKSIELTPENATSLSNLGLVLRDLGKLNEAEASIRKAIETKPDFADAYSNLGIILRDLGKLNEAEISARKAIEIQPNSPNSYSVIGNILRDLGNLEEAEKFYRKATEIKPNFPDAHYNLGISLTELGRLEAAEISYLKAIAFNPNFADAYNNLGALLNNTGKLKEAEIFTRKAIALKPIFPDAHNNLGNVLKGLGKLKDAEVSYSRAIELNPKSTTAIMNRWKLFFKTKQFDLALKDADSVNNEEFRAIAIETLYALGRTDEIYQRIERTAELDDKNIILAAFSSFLGAQKKKYTAHNFCRNPLSFLYFSNIKSYVKDHNKFASELISELKDMEAVWSPHDKTTQNGYQTPTHINIFSESSKNISELKSIIFREIDAYYLKFQQESCSYIKKWPSNKDIKGWYVSLRKQGYQGAHIHPAGWLSGVIYLKVVPPLNNNEGAIEFSLNGANYSDSKSPTLIHQPKVGDIVFFPASLHHRTIPFTTDTDRNVIAFDLRNIN